MRSSETVNTKKCVRPIESRGRSCAWEGDKVIGYEWKRKFHGLGNPLNDLKSLNEYDIYSGNKYWQINGNQAELAKLSFKLKIYPTNIAVLPTPSGVTCRVIIAYWGVKTASDPYEPDFRDYFYYRDINGVKYNSILSDKCMENSNRLEVLYDKIFSLPPENLTDTPVPGAASIECNLQDYVIDILLDLEGRVIVTNGNNSVNTNIIDGNLLFWMVSDDINLNATSTWEAQFAFHLYFNERSCKSIKRLKY